MFQSVKFNGHDFSFQSSNVKGKNEGISEYGVFRFG